MNKYDVLSFLNERIQRELDNDYGISKQRRNYLNMLEAVTEDDISFGDCPNYFHAYLKCNSTGVGTSSFEGSKTQRTVSMDYNTDEYLFIDGHESTAVKGLEIFYLKPDEVVNYYSKKDMKKIANSYGIKLHHQQFSDLNITLNNHRVNRYTANITKGPFSYPIRPIFVSVFDVEQPILVGYVYEKEEEEYIIIELEESRLKGKNKSGCSPWMLLGIIFPPILIIAIIVMLYRTINN